MLKHGVSSGGERPDRSPLIAALITAGGTVIAAMIAITPYLLGRPL